MFFQLGFEKERKFIFPNLFFFLEFSEQPNNEKERERDLERSGGETWRESLSSASGGSSLRSAKTTSFGGRFEEFSSTKVSAVRSWGSCGSDILCFSRFYSVEDEEEVEEEATTKRDSCFAWQLRWSYNRLCLVHSSVRVGSGFGFILHTNDPAPLKIYCIDYGAYTIVFLFFLIYKL